MALGDMEQWSSRTRSHAMTYPNMNIQSFHLKISTFKGYPVMVVTSQCISLNESESDYKSEVFCSALVGRSIVDQSLLK